MSFLLFTDMKDRDTLFDLEHTHTEDFVFDERVVRVFPDMINRSVPGYGLVVPMVGLLARRYAQPGSTLYDLGCSLGAVSLAIRQAVGVGPQKIIAVDNSPDMVRRLRQLAGEESDGLPIDIRQQDIRYTPIENASVVVLNFTLQFIPPEDRNSLLSGIASGLRPGGVLILSEKLRFEDESEQRCQTEWHHDFKRAQGYSDLEIAGKREALENVMKPETEATHRARLRQSGFDRVHRWFQAFSFASFIAFKRNQDHSDG